MNTIGKTLLALAIGLSTASCQAGSAPQRDWQPSAAAEAAAESALRAHVEFLADDLLKGRDTGSAEHEIAALYVASQFKQLGLTPAGEDSGWFQSVPFTRSTLVPESVQMTLHGDHKQTRFESPGQFVTLASALSGHDQVRAKLLFVGYGIVSAQMDQDDYAGLDATGKIVLILAGRPASYPSDQAAHLGSLDEKIRVAAEHGAAGVIFVDTPITERRHAFQGVAAYAAGPVLGWQTRAGGVFGAFPGIKGLAYVTSDAGRAIFSAAGRDLQRIFAEISEDKLPAGFDLAAEITLQRGSTQETIHSSNVIAMLEGSDPVLKNEYVVFSAHLDHLGVNDGVADSIYNGALDNAAGVAILLETARRFRQGERPKRSILFVAVTGEEENLLGSSYFVHNPTVPVDAMVADINLDMPLILYPFADVVAFGAQHSTLAATVSSAANSMGLALSPDPIPEQALFVRSDHYSFVKQGVPSIYLAPGFASTDPTINGGQIFGQFFGTHYHQVSDDTSLPINYAAGAKFTELNFRIGADIANSPSRPRWNEGDFFGDAFKRKAR